MIAYQEFPHTICSSGTDIIRGAAELAKLPQTEYADSINATVKAFETFDKKNRLDAHEIGLIYELSENRVELVLFEKKEDGTFLSVAKGTKDGPVMPVFGRLEFMVRMSVMKRLLMNFAVVLPM